MGVNFKVQRQLRLRVKTSVRRIRTAFFVLFFFVFALNINVFGFYDHLQPLLLQKR